jgi:hypothetical protein
MKVRRSLFVFIASINSGYKTPPIFAPVREVENDKDRSGVVVSEVDQIPMCAIDEFCISRGLAFFS